MNVALVKTDKSRAGSDLFALARDRLPGTGKVAEVREQAFATFERLGLPHRRVEDYKYTDLRALMHEVLPLASVPEAAALVRAKAALASVVVDGAAKLVLVDGVFAAGLSDTDGLDAGIIVQTLREALEAGKTELLKTTVVDHAR